MEEIKRARVPFKRTPIAEPSRPSIDRLGDIDQAAETKVVAKKRPVLTAPEAGLRGNALTGVTLDARPDLPPFLYNPAPKEMMSRRRTQLSRTYAPSPREPQHVSAKESLVRLMNPKTRAAAKLQRLLNINPVVRASFERKAVVKVIPDGRADGTISVMNPGAGIGVSTGAITSAPITPRSPSRDFYGMLHNLEVEVMEQVARVAATANSTSGAWQPSATGPSMPIGSGLEASLSEGPTGISSTEEDEEEGGSWSSPTADAAVGGMTAIPAGAPAIPTSPATSNDGNKSTDIEAQKVNMLVQRLNQMYSLISGMFSKYNQAASSSINSLK